MKSRKKETIFDEGLLIAFSFLTPRDLLQTSPVSQQWKKQSDSSNTWNKIIKPEYKSRLTESTLSAKGLYIKDIDARYDTFYLITEDPLNTIKLIKDITILAKHIDFKKDYIAFSNKESAIKYSDHISLNEDGNQKGIVNYAPILTVRVKNTSEMKVDEYIIFDFHGYNEEKILGFKMSVANINKIYKLFYKAGPGIFRNGQPTFPKFEISISSKDSDKFLNLNEQAEPRSRGSFIIS
jgi:hypothetical protein